MNDETSSKASRISCVSYKKTYFKSCLSKKSKTNCRKTIIETVIRITKINIKIKV